MLARNWWMSWAKLDLIDILRHATTKLRDTLPVDEHPELLARGAEDEALARMDDHEVAHLNEVVEMLNGREREWARSVRAVGVGAPVLCVAALATITVPAASAGSSSSQLVCADRDHPRAPSDGALAHLRSPADADAGRSERSIH